MNRLPFFSFPFAPFYHVVVTTRNNFESETQEELWGHDSYFTRNVANRPYLENDNAYIPILMRTRHANLDIRWSFLFDADLVSWKLSCHRNHRPRQNHRPLPFQRWNRIVENVVFEEGGNLVHPRHSYHRDNTFYTGTVSRIRSGEKATDRASPPGLLPR